MTLQYEAAPLHRALCRVAALAMLSWLSGCSVYDPALVEPQGSTSGHGQGAATGCSEQDDPSCPVRCPETCNGRDDDCDGASDEAADLEPCALAHASSVCALGQCVIASCEAGFADCDALASTGCEATLDSSEHCGACNVRCERINAGASCVDGRCTHGACADGFGDCDGLASNGCERSLHSVSDCGACDTPCTLPHAQMQCAAGSCSFVHCQPGFGDCNADTSAAAGSDGCESDLSQPEHCDACGVRCPTDAPYCSGGRCSAARCPDGFADCSGTDAACSTSLRTVDNCGACGARCQAPPDLGVTCTSSGECALVCGSGLADCDRAASNGCETDLHTADDCGACGARCSYANAAASCSNGSCALGACGQGYGDCNGLRDDGCEQALDSTAHCGQCNQACGPLTHAAASCSSGNCQIANCQNGFGNCDGLVPNGCETDLMNDARNCGTCGQSCPGSRPCTGGVCGCNRDADCPNGQSCCDQQCIDTQSDSGNCGACDRFCVPFGQFCCAGTCNWLWELCR